MARTKRKPGPKPRYGKRRDYHLLLSAETAPGEVISLAEAFEQVAKDYEGQLRAQASAQGQKQQETAGIIAYMEFVLRQRPEIQGRLSEKGSGPLSEIQ